MRLVEPKRFGYGKLELEVLSHARQAPALGQSRDVILDHAMPVTPNSVKSEVPGYPA